MGFFLLFLVTICAWLDHHPRDQVVTCMVVMKCFMARVQWSRFEPIR